MELNLKMSLFNEAYKLHENKTVCIHLIKLVGVNCCYSNDRLSSFKTRRLILFLSSGFMFL